jgi:hypothetical protein
MVEIGKNCTDVEDGHGPGGNSTPYTRSTRKRTTASLISLVSIFLAAIIFCTFLSKSGPFSNYHSRSRKAEDISEGKLDWALVHNKNAMDEIEQDAGHIGSHLQVEELPDDMRANVNPAGICIPTFVCVFGHYFSIIIVLSTNTEIF